MPQKLVCPCCQANLELTLTFSNLRPVTECGWRGTLIKDLYFSERVNNVFKHEGIETAGDIDDRTDNQLMSFQNFGRRSLWEVREIINDLKKARDGQAISTEDS